MDRDECHRGWTASLTGSLNGFGRADKPARVKGVVGYRRCRVVASRADMGPQLSPEIIAAIDRFQAEGVRAELLAVRPLGAGLPLTTLFADDLRARGWFALREPPEGWYALSIEEGVTLLAFFRHRRLAYGETNGVAGAHRDAARALVGAVSAHQVWSNNSFAELVDPGSLTLPDEYGCLWKSRLSPTTFETTLLFAGDAVAALVTWTDED